MKTHVHQILFALAMVMAFQAGAVAQPGDPWAPNSGGSGASMPTARQGTATGVIKGKVYVISGATNSAVTGITEIYNVSKNTWTTGASIPTPRFVPASAVVNSILYVIGGDSPSA